jgi:hypothetical protein
MYVRPPATVTGRLPARVATAPASGCAAMSASEPVSRTSPSPPSLRSCRRCRSGSREAKLANAAPLAAKTAVMAAREVSRGL